MRRSMLALGVACVVSVTAFAQEVVNESVVARIKEEAFQRSK